MQVKLLVDLTSYDPHFTRGALGGSNMKGYTPSDRPWRTCN